MPFPDSPRVVYGKNPLNQVICQLRFPTILKIGLEVPAEFQELIRQDYPLFKQQTAQVGALPPDEILQALPQGMRENLFPAGPTAYDFTSLDEKWAIRLTQDFLALTCWDYERWEQFKAYLKGPLDALLKIYRPAVFSRIGLRYQNVITQSILGLHDNWSDLLSPFIAGELASPEVASSTVESTHRITIKLSDNRGMVKIQHGLVRKDEEDEKSYLIDNDFFIQQNVKTEADDVWNILSEFNLRSRRLFRWCITETLHNAMEPKPI